MSDIDYDRPARRIRGSLLVVAWFVMLLGLTEGILAALMLQNGVPLVVGFIVFMAGCIHVAAGFMLKSLSPIGAELAQTVTDNEDKLSRTFMW